MALDSDPSTTTATVVGVNDAPVADAGGHYSGIVDGAITFDGSGSSDEEGAIVNYAWDFGDGTTGTVMSPTHIYNVEGTYTVNLTVADGDGATSEDSAAAVVTLANTIFVYSIDMWNTAAGRNHFIYTMVTIRDSEEAPMPEAMVTLETTLPDNSIISDSGSTNDDGIVTFKLRSRQTGMYGSEVINVVKTNWRYDTSKNVAPDNSTTV